MRERTRFILAGTVGVLISAYALPAPVGWLAYVGHITIVFLSGVGLWFALDCIREAIRTTRQVRRYLRAYHGNKHVRFRNPTLKAFVGCWVREFASSYNALLVGGLELPHDPTKPVRRRW